MTIRRDDELDRLLHDEEPEGRAELAAVLRSLRDTLDESPSAEVAERHLAAITAAAAEAAHETPTPGPVPARPSRGSVRARRVLGLTAVKVAIGVGAAAAATGTGLAATGNLPDPVQRVVADVAGRVGIDLPTSAADGAPVGDPATTAPAGVRATPDDRGRTEEPGDRRATPTPRADPSRPPDDVPSRGRPPTDATDRRPDEPGQGVGPRDDASADPPAPGRGAAAPDATDRGRVPTPGPLTAADGDAAAADRASVPATAPRGEGLDTPPIPHAFGGG